MAAARQTPVHLRPTRERDVDFVLALEADPANAPHIGSWSREEHLEAIAARDRDHFVLESAAGESLGYAIGYDLRAAGFGMYLKRIVVDGKGRGHGRAAVAALTDRAFGHGAATHVWLSVHRDNERAVRAYRAVGFEPAEPLPRERAAVASPGPRTGRSVGMRRWAPGFPPGYGVRRAQPEDLAALPAVERAAAVLFEGQGLSREVMEDSTSPADFLEAQEEELLWVALDPEGRAVAFAHVEPLGDGAHLEELDVHPDHGRRGLGAALVRAVQAFARESALPGVTLTTFRDVAWNAPFYRRLGFRDLTDAELRPELAERVADEDRHGLARERRVAMRYDASPAAG